MTHISILANWQKEAEGTQERSFRFFRWLKTLDRKRVDDLAASTHAEVFQSIDCLQCTNCCRTLKPEFRERDLQKIADHLVISTGDLKGQYLEKNDQGNWTTQALPCPFLADTAHCRIYEVRPVDCRDFPHTDKTSFANRSWTHSENVATCPAVFAVLERMQERMRWQDQER